MRVNIRLSGGTTRMDRGRLVKIAVGSICRSCWLQGNGFHLRAFSLIRLRSQGVCQLETVRRSLLLECLSIAGR